MKGTEVRTPTRPAAAALALAAIALAGCASVHKANHPVGDRGMTGTPVAVTSPTPTPSPTDDLTGPIGTSYIDTTGDGAVYVVTLTKVIDPATATDSFDAASAGHRLVGAVLRIHGRKGSSSDDANNDITLLGSDGQIYSYSADSITGWTNFNYGEYHTLAGLTVKGAVVFEVPDNVKVAALMWDPTGGFGGDVATWKVH